MVEQPKQASKPMTQVLALKIKYYYILEKSLYILIQGKENSGQTRQGCLNCTFSHPLNHL